MTYKGKRHYDKEVIEKHAKEAKSKHDMLKSMGLPTTGSYGYRLLNHFITLYEIDITHFGGREIGPRMNTIPLEEILEGKHPKYQTSGLKKRLIRSGVMADRCSECGLTEWRGEPIPLECDHINGKSWDHRLENLRLLCRNCHGLTETFCGRNIAKHPKPDAKPSEYRTELADKYAARAQLLRESDIDFSQRGWVNKAAILLGMRHQKVSAWMRIHMPDFYDNCFKK